jgi:hypothetical protein
VYLSIEIVERFHSTVVSKQQRGAVGRDKSAAASDQYGFGHYSPELDLSRPANATSSKKVQTF